MTDFPTNGMKTEDVLALVKYINKIAEERDAALAKAKELEDWVLLIERIVCPEN